MADSSYQIEVTVNQTNIPMNSFVQSFYIHTLLGSLQALRDVPTNVESLTIKIKKAE